MTGMVDISDKEAVPRKASACGRIVLSPGTVEAIRQGRIEKGNVLETARIAAIQGAKNTSTIIPYCHQVPLDSVKVQLDVVNDGVGCRAEVRARSRTGVEMEALVAVSSALLTIWDMVKGLEKDEMGQYPNVFVREVKVEDKWKGPQ
ncbi:MAG: cyclic pyranopterin monophosphate synthase MoaC [Methanomassiliicoccales archaeon]|nr:cyclic pyranopterin monophosphate synthase MoaC [Methanomassiliicoccales archaeon]